LLGRDERPLLVSGLCEGESGSGGLEGVFLSLPTRFRRGRRDRELSAMSETERAALAESARSLRVQMEAVDRLL
jgi:hypothetical protein